MTTQSNIVRYCINNYTNWGRITIRCWIHKCHDNAVQYCKILHKQLHQLRQNINQMLDPQKTPHTLPYGGSFWCLLWIFVRKYTDFNGTALYGKSKYTKIILITIMGVKLTLVIKYHSHIFVWINSLKSHWKYWLMNFGNTIFPMITPTHCYKICHKHTCIDVMYIFWCFVDYFCFNEYVVSFPWCVLRLE